MLGFLTSTQPTAMSDRTELVRADVATEDIVLTYHDPKT